MADIPVKAQDNSEVSLADYKGKVVLVVNTATNMPNASVAFGYSFEWPEICR